MDLSRDRFGRLSDGTDIQRWILGRSGGLQAEVLTYGARLAALRLPVGGAVRTLTLGHPTLEGYVADRAYLGAIVGRYGNRIRDGRFHLDGRTVDVTVNNGPNMLHGGITGFDRAVWQAEPDDDALLLRHRSPDGDQGFPGALDVIVRYAIDDNALSITYTATTDAPTVINLTNHAYFNLAGSGDILGHRLTLHADRFTPVDALLIPTGELAEVASSPFDFRTPHQIGSRIETLDDQLRTGQGYDHNYVLADAPRATPVLAAEVAAAGVTMQVLTTEPGVQFYSGNFLPEAGWPLRAAFCLETQHFPDSPNQPRFPRTTLRPGETFQSRTIYQFSAG